MYRAASGCFATSNLMAWAAGSDVVCAILAASRPVRRTVAPRTTSRRAAAARTGKNLGQRRIRGRRPVPDAAKTALLTPSSKQIGAVCGAKPRYRTSMRLIRSNSRKQPEHCERCASTAARCSGASSPSISAENSSRTAAHSIVIPHNPMVSG
jgi:hypothetical protein